MSKKNLDRIHKTLVSTLKNQREVHTNMIFESIKASIIDSEKSIKENCGLSSDDIAKIISNFPKESNKD